VDNKLILKLEDILANYQKLETDLSNPEIINDRDKYKKIIKKHSELEHTITLYKEYKKNIETVNENETLLEDKNNDKEFLKLARDEIAELTKNNSNLLKDIKLSLLTRDKNIGKNIIVEIRAGTGGDESSLFVSDLFRMYSKYAENHNCKVEVLSFNQTGLKGYKEIIFSIIGKTAYENLQYEMGAHRVQRVPQTETSGRIHTSAVTVAIMPEIDEKDIDINPNDLRIDTYRSSGAGGQHVNTTDSAIRITHLPTNLVVTCQDERSQHKNKQKAMKILRARLSDKFEEEAKKEVADARKEQVGSGDRSERIRTYNFPQRRITDHRNNQSYFKFEAFMEGEIQEMLDDLKTYFKEKQIAESDI